jgi:hypothetical protein
VRGYIGVWDEVPEFLSVPLSLVGGPLFVAVSNQQTETDFGVLRKTTSQQTATTGYILRGMNVFRPLHKILACTVQYKTYIHILELDQSKGHSGDKPGLVTDPRQTCQSPMGIIDVERINIEIRLIFTL